MKQPVSKECHGEAVVFDLDAEVRSWRKGLERKSSLSPRELDELEDHLRARAELESQRNPALTPERAFAVARETLGEATAVSREFVKAGKPRWRRLLLLGWAMYSVSFFLPVTTSAWNTVSGPESGTVWGWQAFLASLLLVGGDPNWILRLSGLSNALVLATFLKLRGKRPPKSAWLTCGLTGAALLNLYWGAVSFGVSVGYWTWVASFACIASAFWVRAKEREPAKPETPARGPGQGAHE